MHEHHAIISWLTSYLMHRSKHVQVSAPECQRGETLRDLLEEQNLVLTEARTEARKGPTMVLYNLLQPGQA